MVLWFFCPILPIFWQFPYLWWPHVGFVLDFLTTLIPYNRIFSLIRPNISAIAVNKIFFTRQQIWHDRYVVHICSHGFNGMPQVYFTVNPDIRFVAEMLHVSFLYRMVLRVVFFPFVFVWRRWWDNCWINDGALFQDQSFLFQYLYYLRKQFLLYSAFY